MKKLIILLTIMMLLPSKGFSSTTLEKSKQYSPLMSELLFKYWNTNTLPEIPYGQVEQESSWNKKATLKTSRELGRGLTQITIAYDSKGKERFNNFKNAVAEYKQLKNWDWRNDPYNEKYQLSYLILQDKSNYSMVRSHMRNDKEAMYSMLVCYNAGEGRWLKRRAVAKAKGIPADIWVGGLDRSYSPSESTKLYGRELYKAVNEYPIVIFKRAEKYKSVIGR